MIVVVTCGSCVLLYSTQKCNTTIVAGSAQSLPHSPSSRHRPARSHADVQQVFLQDHRHARRRDGACTAALQLGAGIRSVSTCGIASASVRHPPISTAVHNRAESDIGVCGSGPGRPRGRVRFVPADPAQAAAGGTHGEAGGDGPAAHRTR